MLCKQAPDLTFIGCLLTAKREAITMLKILSIISAVSIFLAPAAHGDDAKISFPTDYASSFTNYLSLDRTQNPDQIIRLFGNEQAMQGPGPDGKLPYGSVLVAEIYKAKKDADGNVLTSALGRRIRDQLALIAIMQREPGWGEEHPAALNNGNWEFATFKPDGSVAEKDLNACRACHAPLTATNHLFSIEHLSQ